MQKYRFVINALCLLFVLVFPLYILNIYGEDFALTGVTVLVIEKDMPWMFNIVVAGAYALLALIASWIFIPVYLAWPMLHATCYAPVASFAIGLAAAAWACWTGNFFTDPAQGWAFFVMLGGSFLAVSAHWIHEVRAEDKQKQKRLDEAA